ncbi:MAG TPA: autotransporter domain-containing protein [Pseudolabrys sp.]
MVRQFTRRKIAQHSLRGALFGSTAVLGLALAGSIARAADVNWTGNTDNDWNNAANWTPATIPGASDRAIFDTGSPNTFINNNAPASVGSLQFQSDTDFYLVTNSDTFTIASGINNVSAVNTPELDNSGTLNFNGGTITGTLDLGNATNATMNFSNANAGGANINNTGILNFNAGSSAGTATITNDNFGGTTAINFNSNATAGSAVITNNGFSEIDFNDSSTGGTAHIDNTHFVNFKDTSNAENITIVNNSSSAFVNFENNSNAGSANILNTAGFVVFSNSASAGNATIANDPTSTGFRAIEFNNTSTAGNATITTGSPSGPTANVGFFNSTKGGTATIIANSRGAVTFQDTSDAQQATLIANNGGSINFRLSALGDQARLIANNGGTIAINQLTATSTTAGSLEGAGSLNLGAKQLILGSNNLSTTFTGVISGTNGSLTKVGTGNLTLTGAETYTGATVISGGILSVNGSLASSSVTVNTSGTLGGTGTVKSLTIDSGGTLAPGNSIGTLTVNGNLAFNFGSFYAVEVSPTTSDKTIVTGTSALAGTVRASFQTGSYIFRSYTILSAASLGGTTLNALTTSNLPTGFAASLSYSGTDVFLNLSMARPVAGSGYTINQTAVFNGIANSFDLTGGLPGTFTNLTANNLTQISGESATGGAQTSFLVMDMFLNLMLDPFAGARPAAEARTIGFAPETKRAPNAAYAAVTPRDKTAGAPPGWNVWASAFGGSEKNNGDNVTGSHTNTIRAGSAAAGADYRFATDVTLGFSLAGAGTNWGLSESLGGGRSDIFLAGAYASKRWGAAYASAALAYAWNDVRLDRALPLGGSGNLTSGYRADTLGARIETGYRLDTEPLGLTPYAAVQARSYRAPGASETSSANISTYALTYGAQTTQATATEFGAWFDRSAMLNASSSLTWRTRLAWAHEFTTGRSITAAFQTLPGSTFTVDGAAAPANAVLLSTAAEFAHINGWKVGAKFDGHFAASSRIYAGTATLRYGW